MSGFFGIVNFDGRPVDSGLVKCVTQQMAFRGPDGIDWICQGNAGLGFAQLRTTDEDSGDRQPFSFDGKIHIVADARIDARAELIEALQHEGRSAKCDAPDAQLILHAYGAWGPACVDKLLGDFVFAIWDSIRGQLFCARDHFGVKPFYYADLKETMVFGNTLNAIRRHPSVGSELNELAIADFLLFGFNQEPATTSFQDIRRLPPAHVLSRGRGKAASVSHYWALPTDGAVRYRREIEYVEHFRELLETAVADRLRASRIGVLMSGGLDSTSVASMAHHLIGAQRGDSDIRLCTHVYDRLIPDDERHYAGQVAESLRTPIHFESADDDEVHRGWHRPGIVLPEPAENFGAGEASDAHRDFLKDCRVMLTGYGGDPALAPPRAYVLNRILRFELIELVRGFWSCMNTHGRRPSVGIRTLLRDRLSGERSGLEMPAWLNPDLVSRLNLKARWRQITAPAISLHPVRPEAYRALGDLTWPHAFGVFDPGCNGVPMERRHPFFDLRLVSFVLAMPRQPWFERKALLREAMKGMLPEPVRLRPKTFLQGDPALPVSSDFDQSCRDRLLSAPGLSFFVDKNAIPVHIWNEPALSSREYYGKDRAFSLGYWLNYCWPDSPGTLARGAA